MFLVCEGWAGDRDRQLFGSKVLISVIAALLTQPWVTEGPKPSVCCWFSIRHLVSNWLELFVHLVILLFNVHLLPLFFRLFTQVHLLIDGSVEGQYVTDLVIKNIRCALGNDIIVSLIIFTYNLRLKEGIRFCVRGTQVIPSDSIRESIQRHLANIAFILKKKVVKSLKKQNNWLRQTFRTQVDWYLFKSPMTTIKKIYLFIGNS